MIVAPERPSIQEPRQREAHSWLRRLGLAGFLFFLIKGLLWLAVPVAVAVWRSLAG